MYMSKKTNTHTHKNTIAHPAHHTPICQTNIALSSKAFDLLFRIPTPNTRLGQRSFSLW